MSMESQILKPCSVDEFSPVMKDGTSDYGELVSDNDKVACLNMETDTIGGFDASFHLDKEEPMSTCNLSDPPKSSLGDVIEQRGTKRLNDGELDADNKKRHTGITDSDYEADATEDKLDCSTLDDQSKIKGLSGVVVSSSGSDSESDNSDESDDSDDSDAKINVTIR